MNIKFVEINFLFSSNLGLDDLRKRILSEIHNIGEPLRWTISSISPPLNSKSDSLIIIESVVIIKED